MDFLDSDASSDIGTKDARKGEPGRASTNISIESNKDVFRFTDLMQECKVIVQRVSKNEENYQLFKHNLKVFSESILHLDATQEELESPTRRSTRKNILGDLMEDSATVNDVAVSNTSILANPAVVSTKGGSSGRRQLSGLEMATRKRRKCKICNNTGHNRRSCPRTKGDNTLDSSVGRGLPSDNDYDDEAQISQDIMQTAPSIDYTQPGFDGSA